MPWHTLKVACRDPPEKGKKLSYKQQKKAAVSALEKWWDEGRRGAAVETEYMEFVWCNLPPARITKRSGVKLKLEKYEETKQAFLFYSTANPSEGVVTIKLMGVVSREDVKKNNNLVRLCELARERDYGAAQYRAYMQELRDQANKKKAQQMELKMIRNWCFMFPLKTVLETVGRGKMITTDELHARMVKFVTEIGWQNDVAESKSAKLGWEGYRLPTGTDLYKIETKWRGKEYAGRHKELRGMPHRIDVAGYLLGGVAAAVDRAYYDFRMRAEQRRLDFLFTMRFTKEPEIRELLSFNNMTHLLGEKITEVAAREFEKRYWTKAQQEQYSTRNNENKTSTEDEPRHLASSILATLEKKVAEAEMPPEAPRYFGTVHVTDCPPGILEKGALVRKGMVMVFYNEIRPCLDHWMETDQVYVNGLVRANLKRFQKGNVLAFATDTIMAVADKQEYAKHNVGGGKKYVSLFGKNDDGGTCIPLDIEIEELLEMSPPCITNMLNSAQTEKRSLKWNERQAFARYLAGMGVPIEVYDSIAYPLYVAECKKEGNKKDDMASYKRTWKGDKLWSGNFANLNCAGILRKMQEGGSNHHCKCAYTESAKLFGFSPTAMCKLAWLEKHPDDQNILKDVHFPSQLVYASAKAKKRRHIVIQSDSG